MRVFWAIVALLVVASLGAAGFSLVQQQRALADMARAEMARQREAAHQADIIAQAAELEAQAERARAEADAGKPAPPSAAPDAVPKPGADAPPDGPPEPLDAHARIADADAASTPPVPTPTPAPPAPPDSPAARKIGDFEVEPGTIEKRPDGTLLVDGKYVVKGEGTPENPYQITWEQLTSVGTDFDPRAGKKRIPERVAMLHNKAVRIAGYIAFPLMVEEPRECLMMLNQWDGCCIGVPPTPYDAIEVTLAKPATGDNRYAVAGSITGTMLVKPYVMGDWLVGLYVMNKSKMEATDFGGPAGN